MRLFAVLLLVFAMPVQAAETGRIAYTLGALPHMPDGDLIIDIVKRRLDALKLKPSMRQVGTELRVELDAGRDQTALSTLMTRKGVFAIHTGVFPYYGCGAQPAGRACLPNATSGDPFMIVDDPPAIVGGVEKAEAVKDAIEQPALLLTLTPEAAKAFGEVTQENLGKQLAIALDGVVVFAATVQEPILGGQAMIVGNSINAEAWAVILSQPPLPFALEVIAVEVVEPAQ